MLDKILVPIDGSEIFQETLAYLKQLGERPRTEIILLHVQTPGDGHDANDAAGHPLLKGYYDALSENGWNVRGEVRTGDTVDEISLCAAQTEAAMIMMSTHGRSGLENIREGSITEHVVRQSPCPVFILHSTRTDQGNPDNPGDENMFHRMLVPLDGSEVSAAILPCVLHFAKRFNTEVILFHDHPECDEVAEAVKRREFLDQHGVELANAGISVLLDCATHLQPAREILDRTDRMNIDIVAMVTHGQNGERRALDDSVTANVMRHANRPLLVWSSDPQCPQAG
jgi:nucleotide-binding universal stress UspA family protein